MNEAYRASNLRIAKEIVASESMTKLNQELARYGEKHPQLRLDIAREIIKIHKASFPDIHPADCLTTARQYVDEYARFTPERRAECMNRTRMRDPVCHALMQLVLEEKFGKPATTV